MSYSRRTWKFELHTVVILWGLTLTMYSTSSGQDANRYYPLDHREPTGMAGRWSALTKPDFRGYVQPVQVALPSMGTVTFYVGSPHNAAELPAPAQAGLVPGYAYRLKISELPEFPGVELYPTIELIDRLHAPPGLEQQFPVPVEFTADEISIALQDRLITKVIYLEQPDRARPFPQLEGTHTEDFGPAVNLLQAADLRGRPIAIVRIGGRIPDPDAPSDEFHSGSPVVISGTGEPEVSSRR